MSGLQHLSAAVSRRPRATLAFGLALGALALALVPTIEISASRFDLIGLRAEDARHDLVLAVHADDDARARQAVDALAGALRARSDVSHVFARLPGGALSIARASREELTGLTRALEAAPGVSGAVGAARARIEGSGETLDAIEAEAPAVDDDPSAGLRGLRLLLAELERWIEEPGRAAVGDPPPIDARGYLVSRSGHTRYLLVTPRAASDHYEDVVGLVGAAREAAADHSDAEVTVEVTGYPALAVDEVDAIRSATLWTGALAGALALLLFLAAFRSPSGLLFVGAPLGVGVALAFGAIALVFGRLNLLTQAAAPVFIGLGIDFGTHLVSAYAAQRADGRGHEDALHAAMGRPARAVLVGGLTTACACLTLPLARLQVGHDAFAELGYVAGGGLLLVLGAVLVLTPALLTWADRRGSAPLVLYSSSPALGAPPSHRRTLAAISAAATLAVLAAYSMTSLRFDVDVEALLPERAPSLVAARRMRAESDLSTEHMVARVETPGAARALRDRLLGSEAVGRVHSVAERTWSEPAARVTLLARAAEAAGRDRAPPSSDPVELVASLEALAGGLEEVREDARRQGGEGAARELAGTLTQIERTRSALARPRAEARLIALDAALEARLARAAEELRAGDFGDALTLETLPPELRERYVADDGALLVFVEPAEDILDVDALGAFVSAVHAQAPEATGAPVALARFLDTMQESLLLAAALALLVVLLVLAVDLRRPLDVVLALTPITLGMLGTLGVLGALDIPLDMAACAALPLVLGVGVDDGVHLIHRARDAADPDQALLSVRRALVLTTLTTIAGFGTLGLAAHRGMQSFARVMTIGSALCLLVTLFVVPALLWLLRPPEK